MNETTLHPIDCRIPNWDLKDLLIRQCPICCSTHADQYCTRPDRLAICLCSRCRTFFVSPAPSYRQLDSLYATYDKDHRGTPNIVEAQLIQDYQQIQPLADLRIRELCTLMSLPNAKVLDIGFGRAQFLYGLMKLGAIPFGIELDERAIASAKAVGITNVFQCTLEDFADYGRYDLIVMNDFIEHPLDPMAQLYRASQLLDRGGLLLIWTPNGDFAATRDFPVTFRVDFDHMQHLTSDSCAVISAELGLRIVHLESLGFPSHRRCIGPPSDGRIWLSRLKTAIKCMPGFSLANRIRHRLGTQEAEDERMGSYHLFCILQIPA